MRRAAVVLVVITACSGGTATVKATPSTHAVAATPSAGAPVSPPPGAASINCTNQPSPAAVLVLARLTGSPDIVVRDVTDISNARTLCTITASNLDADYRLVGSGKVSYEAGGQTPALLITDLLSGTTTQVLGPQAAGFLTGTYAWDATGSALTYLASNPASGVDWHLKTGSRDAVIATLPPVPGRGIDPNNDSTMVGFSKDGQYVALETTFSTGGSGASAPLQVRRLDGTLAYSRASGTMAVWVGDSLLFRERDSAQVWRWDPASPATASLAFATIAPWLWPSPGPQGDRAVFTWRDGSGLAHVRVVDATGAVRTVVAASGRASPVYLGPWALFYIGESSCGDQCGPGPPATPNGKTYVYDLKTGAESGSRLATVYDVWSPPSAA